MKKFSYLFINCFLIFLLVSCASVEDVRRSTDLIRTDNELTRILEEVRPVNKFDAEVDLITLADHAKSEADKLKGAQGKIPDAIAYYRIASTAYWRSGNINVVNALFEVSNSGTDLCYNLGDKAPDRDCLFLRLVIPFAGLEADAKDKGLAGLLDSVNFNDDNDTKQEIGTMRVINDSLIKAKSLVGKILVVGKDDRLLSHSGMQKYYCFNAQKTLDYYNSTATVFVVKIKEFNAKFPNKSLAPGITVEKARALRILEKEIPSFCK